MSRRLILYRGLKRSPEHVNTVIPEMSARALIQFGKLQSGRLFEVLIEGACVSFMESLIHKYEVQRSHRQTERKLTNM